MGQKLPASRRHFAARITTRLQRRAVRRQAEVAGVDLGKGQWLEDTAAFEIQVSPHHVQRGVFLVPGPFRPLSEARLRSPPRAIGTGPRRLSRQVARHRLCLSSAMSRNLDALIRHHTQGSILRLSFRHGRGTVFRGTDSGNLWYSEAARVQLAQTERRLNARCDAECTRTGGASH